MKSIQAALLTAACLLVLLLTAGCNQPQPTSDSKKDKGDKRVYLASLDLIDLTGLTGTRGDDTTNRYKANLGQILPTQRTTLDSAIFYMAAMEMDSAMQLLARVNRKNLSDSLAAVYYILRANGERVLMGNYDSAIANIDSALALNSSNARALLAKSAILNDLREFPQALAALDSALVLGSPDARTRWYRAMIIAKMGRADEALASIEPDFQNKSVEDYYFLVNLKGWLLCMTNKCEEAIAYHDSALTLNPKHYFGYLDKAIAQYKLERYADMITTLDQADKLVPNQVWVKYNRACCYAKLKQRDGLLTALADAIATDSLAKLNAREDPDFAAFHQDPDFRKLVGLN